jgi:uncharacterized protein (TIGR03437 family)
MKPVFFSSTFIFLLLNGSSAQITLNPVPTRAIGQTSTEIRNVNPNLVEGREFFTPEGIALDTSTNPPALYVSDFGNNRVLGFRNATAFSNGQPADLVLGQPDLVTTLPQGPGGTRTTGLTSPSGIAIDAQGNVYVVDSGNNRILRFPRPFAQSGNPLPDIAIGQSSFATNSANQGGISASTLAFTAATSGTSATLQAFIAFDSQQNLWVADAGNNRVLRFNSSVLSDQASSGPAADIVLGHTDFITSTYTPPATTNPLTSLTAFTTPTGIAFDSAGRLFVSESVSSRRGRILMWTPPFFVGQPASRLLAVDTDTLQPPTVNEFQLSVSPGGLFAIGDAIGAVDTVNSRVLVYPPVEQWTPNTTFQAAVAVAGQSDFSSGSSNRALPAAGPDRLSGAGAAAFYGSELYVADSFNNRVVVFPQSGSSFGSATRVLGQDQMNLNAPNLTEGREFAFSSAGTADAGLAVDLTSNPPHLYVADTYNNRILGYNDLRNVQSGAKADLVIGQPDFQQILRNYPSNDAGKPTASGLALPTGLVVDPDGNLYVADTANGRVLRFPKPFAKYVPGTLEQADLVLGQNSFTATKITDATSRTMSQPYGVATTLAGGLLVSDVALNRVLYFSGPLANLRSGASANIVFGQPDFISSASGSAANQFNAPHHISTDSDDRLYVADSGNGRVSIFDHSPGASPGQPAAQTITSGLSSPRGVYVNPDNGDIWVGDAGTGQAVRYPAFAQLVVAGGASNAALSEAGRPLALVEDTWGNLFMADTVSRVVIHYPGMAPINAANFLNSNILAPGMITSLFTRGNLNQFGGQAANAGTLPLPTELNGIQVLFNGSAVPLFYADPNQINFQVPMRAPQSGTADLQVIETATGRVLGDTTVLMNDVDPGLFTQAGNGIGAAAALNEDNSVNSQTNPALQGSVIQLFGTGQGFIGGAPPDGTVANAQLQTARIPRVFMGTDFVPDENIKYAGLSPRLVGVWQINVVIPNTVITIPTVPTHVLVIQGSAPSADASRQVIVYVKQKP